LSGKEFDVSLARPGRLAAIALLVATIPVAAVASCTPFLGDDFGASDQPAWRQAYANGVYGYRIAIPAGRVAYGSAPPAPNHGVGMVLDGPSRGYVWVDGGYNVYDGVASARDYLDMLERPVRAGDAAPETVLDLHRRALRLGGHAGVLQVKRYRCGHDGPVHVEHKAVAIRDGVVYTVGLETTQTADARDVRVFESVVASWRFLQ
jgi:hypothetical protein